MRKILYFLFACFGLLACKEEGLNESDIDLGYGYFPVEVGSFIEYRADSIWHDQPDPEIEGIHDTTTYFIRETIESLISDAQDEPSMRIVRYKRSEPLEEWRLTDVWLAKRTAQNAQKVEENVRYVKMAFPISASAMWNVNALNSKGEWRAHYDSLFVETEIQGMIFPKTVKVVQRDSKNLIDDEFAYEVYAESVGLIKRYERDLTTRLNYVNYPSAENIRLGHEFKWEIIDYGFE